MKSGLRQQSPHREESLRYQAQSPVKDWRFCTKDPEAPGLPHGQYQKVDPHPCPGLCGRFACCQQWSGVRNQEGIFTSLSRLHAFFHRNCGRLLNELDFGPTFFMLAACPLLLLQDTVRPRALVVQLKMTSSSCPMPHCLTLTATARASPPTAAIHALPPGPAAEACGPRPNAA